MLDNDIEENIESCKADLQMCGVTIPTEDDPLIITALKLWCRSAYTDDVNKAESYLIRYNSFKASLMMAEGYRENE